MHRYEVRPTQLTNGWQLNQPIGQRRADAIAKKIGLKKVGCVHEKQYGLFIAGKGVGGDPASAKLVDQSVRILTNTIGRPLYSKIRGKIIAVRPRELRVDGQQRRHARARRT